MRGREIMKAIMEQKGIGNADLAKTLEVSNATIWERLNNKNVKDIPISLMNEMVRAMGYKVIVVPSTCRIPENGYEVTSKSNGNNVQSVSTTSTEQQKSGRIELTQAEQEEPVTEEEPKPTRPRIKLSSLSREELEAIDAALTAHMKK